MLRTIGSRVFLTTAMMGALVGLSVLQAQAVPDGFAAGSFNGLRVYNGATEILTPNQPGGIVGGTYNLQFDAGTTLDNIFGNHEVKQVIGFYQLYDNSHDHTIGSFYDGAGVRLNNGNDGLYSTASWAHNFITDTTGSHKGAASGFETVGTVTSGTYNYAALPGGTTFSFGRTTKFGAAPVGPMYFAVDVITRGNAFGRYGTKLSDNRYEGLVLIQAPVPEMPFMQLSGLVMMGGLGFAVRSRKRRK